jgi:P27 family predicted phage terminase small subunit
MPNFRTPAARKRMRGTLRKDRNRPRSASERPARCPRPPATLSKGGISEWQVLAPIAHQLGTLCVADVQAFSMLCETLATERTARETVAIQGMTVPTLDGGRKSHPAVKVMETARGQALRLFTEFGMTPRSRNYVTAAPMPAGGNAFDSIDAYLAEDPDDALSRQLARDPRGRRA